MKKLFNLFFIAMIILSFSQKVNAATLDVCSEGCSYSTIKDAVLAANNSDVINIADGTYSESQIVIDKNITITGSSTENTLVNSEEELSIFKVSSLVNVTIKKLTISSSVSSPIFISDGGNVLIDSININNSGSNGIYIRGGIVSISNSKISSVAEDGIKALSNSVLSVKNVEFENINQRAILVIDSDLSLENCNVENAGDVSDSDSIEPFSSISIMGDSKSDLKNVSISSGKAHGISISGVTKKINLTSIELFDIGMHGIYVTNSSDVTLSDIIAENISNSIIYVGNSKGIMNNITGENSGNENYSSIFINNDSEVYLKDVDILSSKSNGISIENTSKVLSLENITVNDSEKKGIYIADSSNVNVKNVNIKKVKGNAIYTIRSKVSLKDCEIDDSGVYDTKTGVFSVVFLGYESEIDMLNVSILSVKDPMLSGIRIDSSSKKILLEAISLKNVLANGIEVFGSTDVKLSNVEIDTAKQGLYLLDSIVNVENIGVRKYVDSGIKIEKSTLNLIFDADFDYSGYQYLGWSINKNCDSFIDVSNYKIDKDSDLYSCYKAFSDKIEKTDEKVDNPTTGDFNIFIIIVAGLMAVGFSIWYYLRIKKINNYS